MTGASAISGTPAPTESGAPSDDRAVEAVELRVPPGAEYLRLARYAAADAATRAGLPIDAVDDLRLAISEMCTLLADSGVAIDLTFRSDDMGVVVDGRGAPGPAYAGENGELARTLVEAVVDDFEFEASDGTARFRVTKRRAAG